MTPQHFDRRLSFAVIFIALCAFVVISQIEKRMICATGGILALMSLIALYKYIR